MASTKPKGSMSGSYDEAGSTRKFWTNIALGVPAIAFLVFIVTYKECDSVCADWDYVTDLLLDDDRANAIQRWTNGPSVTTSTGNREEVEMLAGAVYELNQWLVETGIELRFIATGPADINVTFGTRNELNVLNLNTQIDSKTQGYATWDGQQPNIGRANIFVVRNLSRGTKWGTLLHELGHVMGFAGHTDRYLSSLFHTEFGYGSLSDGFSTDDRTLLKFLYNHLEPGMKKSKVRAAFDEHWVLRSDQR